MNYWKESSSDSFLLFPRFLSDDLTAPVVRGPASEAAGFAATGVSTAPAATTVLTTTGASKTFFLGLFVGAGY
jgi:hypothetical protein